MGKLISIWSFICRRKYLITVVAFAVIIGFLDENSLVRRFGYEREISQLKEEIGTSEHTRQRKEQNIETPAYSADIRRTGTYPDRSLYVYHTRQ